MGKYQNRIGGDQSKWYIAKCAGSWYVMPPMTMPNRWRHSGIYETGVEALAAFAKAVA